MLGMDKMAMQDDEQNEGHDVEAKLQVLQEIKDLMDQRLGDSMKPKEVSIEKLSMSPEGSPEEEQSESPMMEAKEDSMGDDSGLSPEDKEKLKMMYSGMK